MTALVTKHLPLVAGAPDGIEKLRGLIQDLAIQGKLVAQDANEETSSKLLAQIDSVKGDFLRKSELARFNSLAGDTTDICKYTLPKTWSWRRLGALGLVGSSSRVHQKDWQTSGVPFYRTREIVQLARNGAVDPELFISEDLYLELTSSGPVPVEGDIMITGVGTIGVPYIVREGERFYFKDASVLIFKNYFRLNSEYLALVFSSPYWDQLIHQESMGTTVHTLTIGRASAIPIPLPPLAEQHRIVAKVDELMALCDRLEADQADAEAAHAQLVQALLDSLTQATDAADFRASWQRLSEHFHTLFTTEASIEALKRTVLRLAFMGKLVQQLDDADASSAMLETIAAAKAQLSDAGRLRQVDGSVPATRADVPFDFPAAWQVARMADLCEPVTSGSTPPSSEMDECEGIPFLKVYNIREQRIDFDYKRQFVAEAFHFAKMKRSALKPNDVVMNIVGPPLGKTAIIPDDYATWNCNQAIVFFRLIAPMSPRYVHLFLCEGSFLEGIDLIGTAGQDNISVTKSRNIVMPVPTAAEQHRIVAKVDELMALCDQLKAQLQ
ncbi:MAG TPA: restriction endonuclease subunit S, partial [Aquabacterium sp.]|nr:restriction endonuclease subunit S [Aquabacterium sp.]